MIGWIRRRLIEWWHLRNDLGAPPGQHDEGGWCTEPHCCWPYHAHELFRRR